jgi:hypothetical protein
MSSKPGGGDVFGMGNWPAIGNSRHHTRSKAGAVADVRKDAVAGQPIRRDLDGPPEIRQSSASRARTIFRCQEHLKSCPFIGQVFSSRAKGSAAGGVKSANLLRGRGAGRGPPLYDLQDGSIYGHILRSTVPLPSLEVVRRQAASTSRRGLRGVGGATRHGDSYCFVTRVASRMPLRLGASPRDVCMCRRRMAWLRG